MRNRSRSFIPAVIMILFAASLCITALSGANYVLGYIETAEELYGPANPSLTGFQYIRLAYTLVENQGLLLNPANPTGPQMIFTIEPGEAADSVLERMQTVGLIADRELLRDYLIYTGYDTRLQAGEFLLSPAMTPVEIIAAVLDTSPQVVTFFILPGWRLEEIAAALPTSGLDITPDEFLRAASIRPAYASFTSGIPLGVLLEGFMLPDEYKLSRDLTANQLVRAFIENFDRQVTLELRQAFIQQGLNLHQAVTLASIIQREAVLPEEGPMIASVFYNRLAAGMLLETDPTVQYALGYNSTQGTWWTNPLSYADLEVDSPYNTYRYPGLPPAPIANPALSALQAAAYPAQTNYYYFRSACDGSGRHNFAQTFEEHQNNACP